jgi:hypothetical protein
MTGELRTALRIDATTSGQDKVAALAQALIGIGVGAEQAEEMAKGIAGEIDKLGPKKQAIADLEAAFRGLGMSEQEAAVAAKQTVSGLDEIAQGAGEVGDQSARSALSVNDLANQIAGMVTAGAILQFARDSVQAYGQAEASFRGLEAVAKHAGVAIGEAMDTANRIASDGLVSVADASKALQNLLSRGYQLDEAEATLGRLKDAAAFNRQANLSLSEAVLSATEGLKNENSVLVDNAGVTKNVAKMWEEYARQQGITTQEMTQAQKIQAEYNGIMAETEAQVGNAKKALEGYQGEVARAEQATRQFKEQLGQSMVPVTAGTAQAGTIVIEKFLKPIIFLMQKAGIEIGKTVADFGSLYDAITNLDFSNLEQQLNAHADLAEEELLRIAKGLDTNTLAIAEQAREQEKLGAAGEQAGQAISDGQEKAAAATGKTQDAAKQLADDLKHLQIDPEEFVSGMKTAEAALVESFDRLVTKASVSSDMLMVGFGEAIQEVGIKGLEAFEFAIQEAFQKGRISAEQLDAAMQMVEVRGKELTSGAGALADAYATLGIQSQESLDAAATAAKAAYETIRDSGAGVEVLNAAWAKYAEAAIASNGGVADSTIQAEAHMRGYIITVDDAGRAVLRLREITDNWSERVIRATAAANRALTQAAQQQSELYNATSGGIGGLQDSVDQFHQHLRALGDGLAQHINYTRNAVFAATKGSEEAMRQFNELAVGGAMQTHWLGQAIAAYYKAMDNVIGRYSEQMEAANRLIERLRAATSESASLADSAIAGAMNFSLLDKQSLSNLKAAIEAAHQRMVDFGESAGDTVANLREQLAEMRGEYLAVEQAQGEQRIAELQAKLKEAQDALAKMTGIGGQIQGDPEAVKALQQGIRDLQESIKLQEQLNTLREDSARQREDEAKQRQQQTTPQPVTAPTPAPILPAPVPVPAPAPSAPAIPTGYGAVSITIAPGAVVVEGGIGDPSRMTDAVARELAYRLYDELVRIGRLHA